MLDIVLCFILGCLFGIITGLTPGIHTNTVAAMVLSFLPILTKWFSPLALAVLLTSMVVVHSFVDFIPTIFLGAPDEGETSLSVLPGHAMLLQGRGYDALKLTVVGGVGATLFALVLLPFFCAAIFYGYDKVSQFIPFIILLLSLFFILKEKDLKSKIWAVLIFLFSGVLGVLTLNILPVKDPLFPLLTGLFGIPTLIISLFSKNKIVEQKINDQIAFKGNWANSLKASLSAASMSVLPAMGAAQATILAQYLSRKSSKEAFLTMVGGINSSSAIFVLTTLWLIGRARTGVLAVLKQFLELSFREYVLLLLASLVAVGFAVLITLVLGKVFSRRLSKIKYRKLVFFILLFLFILVLILSGPLGLLICSIGAAIGLIAPLVGTARIHAMACIAIPVIFYFFGM